MIYSVTGKLVHMESNLSVVESNGIGFAINTSASTQRDLKLGDTVILYTYMNVREDAIELFGFSTSVELSTFKLLISVSGVGPKYALSILSSLTTEQIAVAVSNNDYKTLTVANGIGPKVAQRIVLEIKDKFKNTVVDVATKGSAISNVGNISQAVNGLAVLGYSADQVTPILSKLDPTLSVQELIKQTLKEIK